MNPVTPTVAASLDPAEVEKFSKIAAEWWDPRGTLAVLHTLNPIRLAFIKEQVTARFARDPFDRYPFRGLRFLDIGCGGGLLSEPVARLGAKVLGVDPSAENIGTAKTHAAEQDLEIDYRTAIAENLLAEGESFDVILAMEVVEHVSDPAAFLGVCARLLRPGGLIFVATINRTLKSFALAIIGAEYILGWLPRGTHQWERLIKPEELHGWLGVHGLRLLGETGVAYSPLTGEWRRARDMDVNYMLVAQKPTSAA